MLLYSQIVILHLMSRYIRRFVLASCIKLNWRAVSDVSPDSYLFYGQSQWSASVSAQMAIHINCGYQSIQFVSVIFNPWYSIRRLNQQDLFILYEDKCQYNLLSRSSVHTIITLFGWVLYEIHFHLVVKQNLFWHSTHI